MHAGRRLRHPQALHVHRPAVRGPGRVPRAGHSAGHRRRGRPLAVLRRPELPPGVHAAWRCGLECAGAPAPDGPAQPVGSRQPRWIHPGTQPSRDPHIPERPCHRYKGLHPDVHSRRDPWAPAGRRGGGGRWRGGRGEGGPGAQHHPPVAQGLLPLHPCPCPPPPRGTRVPGPGAGLDPDRAGALCREPHVDDCPDVLRVHL
mmetsp:Transcript_97245/g.167581  ORF Transcript_97245/g.167581 Transcript_97245/m.167581 type:complete len:202 (+) Transcript_97245:200-805(+)